MNISLRIQGKVDWDLNGVIWPIYVGLGFSFIIIVGITLFTLGSFMSWLSDEISTKEFLSTLWVFTTLLGASSSILLVSWHFTQESTDYLGEYFLIFPIVYLSFFVLSLALFMKHIVEWWRIFFSFSEVNEEPDSIHVEPNPQNSYNFRQQVAKVIKKTPDLLMRISSSYFQPMPTPKRNREKKTFSLQHSIDNDTTIHRRIFSAPEKVAQEVKGLSGKPDSKTCSLCCEKISDAVIMECGHGGICYDCSLELWRSTGACHMCRSEISQVLQVELVPKEVLKVCSATRAVYSEI